MKTSAQLVADKLLAQREAIVGAVVTRMFQAHPELELRWGQAGREKCRQDCGYHLSYLAEAISAENVALFTDYVAWVKVMLAQRGIGEADLAAHFTRLRSVLQERLAPEEFEVAGRFLTAALAAMPTMPADLPVVIGTHAPLSALAHQYLSALMRGERHLASQLILDVVERETPVKAIYLHVFQPALYEIGRLWQTNRISVAQEHYCTAATQLIMSQLYGRIFSHERNGRTLVATCVAGDLHEIGARMVTDFFEMEGWNTFYIGANAPTPSVVATVLDRRADVLAISATITYHVPAVEELIAAVRRSPAGASVKILVGGYPFNLAPDLWQKIGADGSAPDAQGAIALATSLVTAGASPS
ncbi:MAG: cobalamin-dependent protein [Opitutaceae bacterium]